MSYCDKTIEIKTNAIPIFVTDKSKLYVTELETGTLITAVSTCGKQTNGMVFNDYGLAVEAGYEGTLEEYIEQNRVVRYYTTVEPGNYNNEEENVYKSLEDCISGSNPVKNTEIADRIVNNHSNVRLCIVTNNKVTEELLPVYAKYDTEIMATFMKTVVTPVNISMVLYNFGKFEIA